MQGNQNYLRILVPQFPLGDRTSPSLLGTYAESTDNSAVSSPSDGRSLASVGACWHGVADAHLPTQYGKIHLQPRRVTIIDLHSPWIVCVVCGKEDVSLWGMAVYEGQIVPDDYTGEWGGAPCCEECYAAWRNGTIKPWMTFAEARNASSPLLPDAKEVRP